MNREDLLNYIASIVSSAKGCLKEPKIYGPFRLVDSIEMLIKLLERNNIKIDQSILKIVKEINNKKLSFMEDESSFTEMLDKVTFDLIEEMNRTK